MNFPELDGAKVGDTIEISYDKCHSFREQFVVVHSHSLENCVVEPKIGDVWVLDKAGIPLFVRFQWYKVIKRLSQDTKSVDAFLRKQLDNNLGSIFS